MNIQASIKNINKPFAVLIVILVFGLSACCPPKAKQMEEPVMETTDSMPELPPANEVSAMASDDVYIVIAGQSLWRISEMPSIYNDPYRWPLIYARNKDIEDADLIYPGQRLLIRRDLMRTEINAAVMHARNRGSWSLGAIEETDLVYRAGTM